jgi:hypothetical protein
VTVETNVKYHSSLKTTDLFIVESASKITNLNAPAVDRDLVVEVEVATVEEVLVMAVEALASEEAEVLDLVETDQEKCILQPVATVEMNVKYHSNQRTIDQFIAKNASKITDKISQFF